MTNICSDKLPESKSFYTTLFKFKVDFDSDWFVHLISEETNLELGIIDRTNEIVPLAARNNAQGLYITFVVDSADKVFEIALEANYTIVEEPKDTFYGQRRFIVKDPNGVLVDVSSPIATNQA